MATRPIIRVPGQPAPTEAPTAAPVDDDFAGLEEGGTLPAVDPVQAQLAALTAEVARLKRKGQPEQVKPLNREPEMSEDEAYKHMSEQAAAGIRPRAILTPSGWVTHPEMARGPGSLGNAIPGAGR